MPECDSVQTSSSGGRTSSNTARVGYSLPSASFTMSVSNAPPGRASTLTWARGAVTPAGPQKWARWSGSVMQRNTSSRGASKTRRKRSSPVPSMPASSSATGLPRLFPDRRALEVGQ